MAGQPTVYDVAARAGVSIATVSRVLSRPDDVRPDTRAKVAAAVDELGYVRNAAARGLAGRRTRVLGLVLPAHEDVDETPPPDAGIGVSAILDDRSAAGRSPDGAQNLYFDELIRGAERAASAADHALLIAAGSDSRREGLLHETAARVDGLIVLAATLSEESLARAARRAPVVLVAGDGAHPDIDRVSVANEDGMHALTRVVLDGGARRIVFLGGPSDSPDGMDRRRGFDQAIAEAGRVQVEYLPGDFAERVGRDSVERLLAERGIDGLPDAIVCGNDQSALGALDALRHAGVDVPGRVRVTGFDGVEAGRFSTPRLSTVRQPMADLGVAAVRLLLERLDAPDAAVRSVVLPVEVLLRESCPPIDGPAA